MENSPEQTAKEEYRTKVAARSEGTLQEGTHYAKKPVHPQGAQASGSRVSPVLRAALSKDFLRMED